jgi:hypothetical protein
MSTDLFTVGTVLKDLGVSVVVALVMLIMPWVIVSRSTMQGFVSAKKGYVV